MILWNYMFNKKSSIEGFFYQKPWYLFDSYKKNTKKVCFLMKKSEN